MFPDFPFDFFPPLLAVCVDFACLLRYFINPSLRKMDKISLSVMVALLGLIYIVNKRTFSISSVT